MTFHGQSVLSCVWGVTHTAAAPESPAAGHAEMTQRSGSANRARLRILSQLVRKLRHAGANGAAGPANPR